MGQQIVIMKMSAAYEGQDFYRAPKWETEEYQMTLLDARGISGTDCYCDEEAKRQLRRLMRDLPPSGLHFLDSGNFHYLSLLWMEKILEPFDLALIDFHPDMQRSALGAITSCGGWALEAAESMPYLKHIYVYGVDPQLLCECRPLPETVRVCRWDQAPSGEYPLYLSLDKDVMSEQFARSDWSQGQATLGQVIDLIERLYAVGPVIGTDICGECARAIDSEADRVNNETNQRLLRRWLNLMTLPNNDEKERMF